MEDFSELLKEAMRKAAARAAKEAVESLLRAELSALLGYGKHDPAGRNSGDSRNGTYQRTIQTSLGAITIEVPRNRNGEYCPAAIPRYGRRTDLVTSTVLKPYPSGMTDEELRLAISSIYEASLLEVHDIGNHGRGRGGCQALLLEAPAAEILRPLPRLHIRPPEAGRRTEGGGEHRDRADRRGGAPRRRPLGYPGREPEACAELLEGFRARGPGRVEVAVTDGVPGVDEAVSRSFPGARR